MLLALHHVQLAMPRVSEAKARDFYSGVLGLAEVAKPAALAGRGGVWFEHGELRVHLGVEDPFRPAKKAHPAFTVTDLAGLAHRLTVAGAPVRGDAALDGLERLFTEDPFGNRIELIELHGSGAPL